MRKTAIAGAVVAALALASCATQGDKAPVSSLRFGYTTEGGKAIGLVRAFDDGQRTALQFVTDPPTALQVFDGEGKPLAYQRIGQNAVLPGLYSPVRVQIGPASATVKSTVPVVTKEPIQQPTPEPTAAATVPADTNTELLAARAALKLAEKQIAELRAEVLRLANYAGMHAEMAALALRSVSPFPDPSRIEAEREAFTPLVTADLAVAASVVTTSINPKERKPC